jgi:hypothetical protein
MTQPLTVSGGTFNGSNGTLVLRPDHGCCLNPSFNVHLNQALSVDNLRIEGAPFGSCTDTWTLSGTSATVSVGGAFTMGGAANCSTVVSGGTINTQGNVSILASAAGGTTALGFVGTGVQTVTHTAGTPLRGTWTVDKPSGSVLLGSNVTLSGTNQRLVVRRGRLDLSTRTLSLSASGGGVDFQAGQSPELALGIADATTAGRITATGTVTGISSAGLFISVPGTPGSGTYTLVSNSTSFGSTTFGSVTFPAGTTGTMSYASNSGRNITLSNVVVTPP